MKDKDSICEDLITRDSSWLEDTGATLNYWEALEIASRGYYDSCMWCARKGFADENALAHAAAEKREREWERIVDALVDTGKVNTTSLACCLAQTGEKDKFMEILEMASTARTHPAIFLDAAAAGFLEALKLLVGFHDTHCIAEALAFSAANGHVDCLNYLREHFPKHRAWWQHSV